MDSAHYFDGVTFGNRQLQDIQLCHEIEYNEMYIMSIYICMYVYMYMSVYVCVCVHVWVHVCVCV